MSGGKSGSLLSSAGDSLLIWSLRASLSWELTVAIVDVCFSPPVHGCKVAACSAQGDVRLFECMSSFDLRKWDHEDLESIAHPLSTGGAVATLDWRRGASLHESENETLVIAGRTGQLAIWEKSGRRGRWAELASVDAHPEADGVQDVAWCPNLWRSYEIIATCGAGAALWRADFTNVGSEVRRLCQVQLLETLVSSTDDTCPVWRCSWNLTGTMLAISSDRQALSVWKSTASQSWKRDEEMVARSIV